MISHGLKFLKVQLKDWVRASDVCSKKFLERRKGKKAWNQCMSNVNSGTFCHNQNKLATSQLVVRKLAVHFYKVVVCKSHSVDGRKYVAADNKTNTPKCAVRKMIACFVNKPVKACLNRNRLDPNCFVPCDESHERMLASGSV